MCLRGGRKGKDTRREICVESLEAMCPLLFLSTYYVFILCEGSPGSPRPHSLLRPYLYERAFSSVLFFFSLFCIFLRQGVGACVGKMIKEGKNQEDCSETKDDREQKETSKITMPFPPLLTYLPDCVHLSGLLACFFSFLLYYSSVNASLFCFLAFARPFAHDDQE